MKSVIAERSVSKDTGRNRDPKFCSFRVLSQKFIGFVVHKHLLC